MIELEIMFWGGGWRGFGVCLVSCYFCFSSQVTLQLVVNFKTLQSCLYGCQLTCFNMSGFFHCLCKELIHAGCVDYFAQQ